MGRQDIDQVMPCFDKGIMALGRFADAPQHHGRFKRDGVKRVASHAVVAAIEVRGDHGHTGGKATHRIFDVHVNVLVMA